MAAVSSWAHCSSLQFYYLRAISEKNYILDNFLKKYIIKYIYLYINRKPYSRRIQWRIKHHPTSNVAKSTAVNMVAIHQ